MNQLTKVTISHYENNPESFWSGTKDHDVSQNYKSFLSAIKSERPFKILDLGCGPGRDLKYFKKQGHLPIGLDGCPSFCRMAKAYSKCEVLEQDFIDLNLDDEFFDGVFANASLFHVPKSELVQVLNKLNKSLKNNGVLFSSNPRGNTDGIDGMRYSNLMEIKEYKKIVESCNFRLIDHYYRPNGIPVENRPWLACLFRKR